MRQAFRRWWFDYVADYCGLRPWAVGVCVVAYIGVEFVVVSCLTFGIGYGRWWPF